MAERTQYQYQPVTGPVWSEPVASRLAWVPSGQWQPARGLSPNRLGDFVQPAFDALYKPALIQWMPSERYAGRLLPYSGTPYYVRPAFEALYKPEQLEWRPEDRYLARFLPSGRADYAFVQLVVAAFDPQTIEWVPSGRAPSYLESRRVGDFAQPSFAALYDPQRLEWQARDGYFGRAALRSAFDYSVLVQLVTAPVYNPQTLEWIPSFTPRASIEVRLRSDFQQPAFDILFKPQLLQWLPYDRYYGRSITISRYSWTVFVQLVGRFRRNSNMDGLTTSGPFFRDPSDGI